MIRAAIVGLGRWGQIMVESVQGKSETIQFTAGVTRTVSKAAAFMEQHAIPPVSYTHLTLPTKLEV